MDTYYDRLNAFFKFNATHPLQPEDQLVMLHLLHHNNKLDNIGKFYLTDSQLAEQTRIPKSNITAIKRRLKNYQLIDFKTNPKTPALGTLYTLPALKKPEVKPKPGGQYLSANSEAVRKAWRECAGENLTGGKAFGMIELENTYGTQMVVAAIIKADQSNTAPRLSFNYVKAVLENKKGESKRAGTYRKSASRVEHVGSNERIDDIDTNIPPEYRYIIESAQDD